MSYQARNLATLGLDIAKVADFPVKDYFKFSLKTMTVDCALNRSLQQTNWPIQRQFDKAYDDSFRVATQQALQTLTQTTAKVQNEVLQVVKKQIQADDAFKRQLSVSENLVGQMQLARLKGVQALPQMQNGRLAGIAKTITDSLRSAHSPIVGNSVTSGYSKIWPFDLGTTLDKFNKMVDLDATYENWSSREAILASYASPYRTEAEISRLSHQMNLLLDRQRTSGTESKTLLEWAGDRVTVTVTATVVFTDIVGSTSLGKQMSDRDMNQVIDAHFSQSQRLIETHSGYFIKNTGDGIIAAFHTPREAIEFALAVHANPGDERLKVRVGVHTGEVEIRDNDVRGSDVHYAARVMHMSDRPEIWISDRTKHHIDQGELKRRPDLHWTSRDNCELKGFEGEHTLWKVTISKA